MAVRDGSRGSLTYRREADILLDMPKTKSLTASSAPLPAPLPAQFASNPKRWGFQDEVFEIPIILSTESLDEFYDSLEEEYFYIDRSPFSEECRGVTYGINSEKKGFVVCVWLNEETADAGAVAHEAFHATSYVMEYLGVKFDPLNHETFAYYLDWLVTEFTEAFDPA